MQLGSLVHRLQINLRNLFLGPDPKPSVVVENQPGREAPGCRSVPQIPKCLLETHYDACRRCAAVRGTARPLSL